MSQRFLLYAIDDAEWHSLDEVAEALQWTLEHTNHVARYLSQGRFIHYDEHTGKVKLQPWIKRFPRGEWTGPGKRSTGVVSLPPNGSLTLQETLIQNTLDIDIEIYFSAEDEKLTELLISKRSEAPKPPL